MECISNRRFGKSRNRRSNFSPAECTQSYFCGGGAPMIAILLPSIAFVLSVKHGLSNGFDCSREMGFFIAGNDSVKSCSSFCSGVASDEFAFSLYGLDFCSIKITFPPSVLVRRTDWFASTQFV